MSRGYVPAHAAPPERARLRRVLVDAWYLPCVMVPLMVSMTAPGWYFGLVDPGPRSVDSVLRFLAASWTPWVLAALGTIALAVKYELQRRPRGRNVANAWDRFSLRLLGLTGAAGAVISLVVTGVALGTLPV